MPELVEQMYCSQQIVIPPKFPYILKRFAKAAIKTQPYDLLRWSCEYFHALADGRLPPVKLRLEYPVFNTEGGLTRGYLRLLVEQLRGAKEISLPVLQSKWRGACLDPEELSRILCMCGAVNEDAVLALVFFAVAGGLLTKSLTQTMILLCETLTEEPEGGSASVPLDDFLIMYDHLARLDASKDCRYINGLREGAEPPQTEEEQSSAESTVQPETQRSQDVSEEFYPEDGPSSYIAVTNDKFSHTSRISRRLAAPLELYVERSPSVERDATIERETYARERRGRAESNEDIDNQLRELSKGLLSKKSLTTLETEGKGSKTGSTHEDDKSKEKKGIQIVVYDEEEIQIPLVIYGAEILDAPPKEENDDEEDEEGVKEKAPPPVDEIAVLIEEHRQNRLLRVEDYERTLDELAIIVDKWKHANYDLGMVAGRQMSTTSGEFIAQSIEREIMDVINEQIAVLPDPDLKKKKAKPEEVAMIRELMETFLDENMETIVPEQEAEEEEEEEQPEIIEVKAVPGIGAAVDENMMAAFVDYAREVVKPQAGLIMPRNLRHFMCPPLELYLEPLNINIMEEVPAGGGVITE